MCVVLSMYGPRGDVEPIMGLTLQLHTLLTEVEMRTPPDCVVLPSNVGALLPAGARR